MNIILTLMSMLVLVNCNRNTSANQEEQTDNTYRVEKYTKKNKLSGYSQAVFAGGCFWCTEAAFERIDGVVDVISGYAGGHKDFPEYGEVGAGVTGHTESIFIYYDKETIDYETLLNVFFIAHDPTTLNRQGPDAGEEYRSALFYQSDEELASIKKIIKKTNEEEIYTDAIVTQVTHYKEFWVAESYHQNYYELHPDNGYVARVSRPKVEKVKKTFPELLKKKYKK